LNTATVGDVDVTDVTVSTGTKEPLPVSSVFNGKDKPSRNGDDLAVNVEDAAQSRLGARYRVALHWGGFPLMNARHLTTRTVGQWARVVNVSRQGGKGQFKFREAHPVMGYFGASELKDASRVDLVKVRGTRSKQSRTLRVENGGGAGGGSGSHAVG
jgi:hypothetical protein